MKVYVYVEVYVYVKTIDWGVCACESVYRCMCTCT